MNPPRIAVLALTIMVAGMGSAIAQSREDVFFRELDTNGDGFVDREEFEINKGQILYTLDRNRSLTLEQPETKLSADQFRHYAGADGVIDGLELFDLPQANFGAFDRNGDQKVSKEELNTQIAAIRGGPQTATRP